MVGGDGPQRAEIEAEIATRNLRHRVTLLGHVEDVPRLLQALICSSFRRIMKAWDGPP